MTRQQKRRWLLVLVVLACVLVVGVAFARPGGGHSYSGGSRSSGSSSRSSGGGGGGGGDGGFLIEILIYLIIENPAVGIPLLIIVAIGMLVRAAIQRGMKSWSTTTTDVSKVTTYERPTSGPRKRMEELRAVDPEFSVVLFEDFVYMMYTALHRSRAIGTGPISAYLEPSLAAALPDPNLADVQGIIIGALKYEDFSGLGTGTIRVEFSRTGPSGVRLAVKNDGIRLPDDFESPHSPSLGLHLVSTLARQLNAELEVTRERGTAFQLKFQLPEEHARSAHS